MPFDYAAKLTEIMLLGIVSLRANSKLHYDAANDARHQQRRRERLPDARVPGGLFVVDEGFVSEEDEDNGFDHEDTKTNGDARRTRSRLLAPRERGVGDVRGWDRKHVRVVTCLRSQPLASPLAGRAAGVQAVRSVIPSVRLRYASFLRVEPVAFVAFRSHPRTLNPRPALRPNSSMRNALAETVPQSGRVICALV